MAIGRLLIVAFISTSLLSSLARAERVGYKFEGKLYPANAPGVTTFGQPIPSVESDVVGTFSYDTSAAGVDLAPGVRSYSQLISGGYSLDADLGTTHLLLKSSDYHIGVANDFGSPASDIIGIGYRYSLYPPNGPPITPEKLNVNGVEWPGPTASVNLQLFWDATQFADTELTPDKPGAPGFGIYYTPVYNFSSLSDGGTAVSIRVTAIQVIEPRPGDYNIDGKIDNHDYVEWKKAFGHTEPEWLYADGNHDGIVDAADYLYLRKTPAPTVILTVVPEPSGLTMIATWIAVFVWRGKTWRRDAQQH